MSKSEKKTSRDKLLDVTFDEVYRYGYCGASTATILKKASVPRGSMYHHFASKKEMVLAMIEERLIPKVRDFFDFKLQKDSAALEVIDYTMQKMSKNKMLIAHGCPLHRLMFEMGALDEDIALACQQEFVRLSTNYAKLLEYGMDRKEIERTDAKALAEFFITATWGILSRLPKESSKEQFLQDISFLMRHLTPTS